MGKLLFFDIDGTLVGYGSSMPDSAVRALEEAKRKGHRLFICTGRSRNQIYGQILDFGFDGLVAATGGYVEYRGKILRHITFGEERMKIILDLLDGTGTGLIIQKRDYCVASSSFEKAFLREFAPMVKAEHLNEIEGLEAVRIDEDVSSYPVRHADTDSFIYCSSPYDTDELRERFGHGIHVETASYKEPEPYSGELTLDENSKAVGIQTILDYLGMEREDVIAFGDGANDIEMLDFAGFSVVMGNATDRVKTHADYVTSSLEEDGIYRAMKHLELI